jgi:hypothetical protein
MPSSPERPQRTGDCLAKPDLDLLANATVEAFAPDRIHRAHRLVPGARRERCRRRPHRRERIAPRRVGVLAGLSIAMPLNGPLCPNVGKVLPGAVEHCFPPGEVLPALYGDIDIGGVQLDGVAASACHLGSDDRRA